MRLQEWLTKNNVVAKPASDGVLTVPLPPPGDRDLWTLSDYRVVAVQAGSVWLFGEPKNIDEAGKYAELLWKITDIAIAAIKPGRIEEIIPQLVNVFIETRNCESAEDITETESGTFADHLVLLVPDARVLGSYDFKESKDQECLWDYEFVMYGNLYYDAQTPDGVKDWKELPMVKRRIECEREYITREHYQQWSKDRNIFLFSQQ